MTLAATEIADAHPTRANAAVAPSVSRGVVVAAVAGNALEFYDFLVYAFFAVYIGKTFFPASTAFGSLLLTVAVFGVGFVTRPLGGLLFGAVADRAGRRPAMLWTVALITIGTLALAVTPSYERIGPAAPLIVVAARLVQGLALRGEVGPSSAFLVESAGAARRGLYGSWQSASQGVAILVASLVGLLLTSLLDPAQMLAWGWRAPFALTLLAVPFAFRLRRAMPETLRREERPALGTGRAALGRCWRIVVLAVLSMLAGTVSSYVGNYMTTYAIVTLKLPPMVAMAGSVALGVATLAFALLGGWLSDRFGRKRTMLWPRVMLVVLTVPAFEALIRHPTMGMLVAVSFVLAALNAVTAATTLVAIPELFPGQVRATGMSIAYAIGVALFGGTTQFVVTWLIGFTGDPVAPAWYVAATSVVSAIAMAALPETRGRALRD